MCWAAVMDPSACTCEIDPSRIERAEIARSVAEDEIMRLREKLRRHADRQAVDHRTYQRLWKENADLRAALSNAKSPPS